MCTQCANSYESLGNGQRRGCAFCRTATQRENLPNLLDCRDFLRIEELMGADDIWGELRESSGAEEGRGGKNGLKSVVATRAAAVSDFSRSAG
eukprot:g8868.t1